MAFEIENKYERIRAALGAGAVSVSDAVIDLPEYYPSAVAEIKRRIIPDRWVEDAAEGETIEDERAEWRSAEESAVTYFCAYLLLLYWRANRVKVSQGTASKYELFETNYTEMGEMLLSHTAAMVDLVNEENRSFGFTAILSGTQANPGY